MGAPAIDTVLVGVDGSEEAAAAAHYAVAIAKKYDATLAILHILGRDSYRSIEAGTSDPQEVSADAQAAIAEIEVEAERQEVTTTSAAAYGFSAQHKLIHPGSVVLDTAEDMNADFIVLPRESVERADPGDQATLAKAAEYALLYASQPVLAV